MADISRPGKGITQNNTTPIPRTGHGDVGQRRVHAAPTVTEARAVATLAARLQGAATIASSRLRHVGRVA